MNPLPFKSPTSVIISGPSGVGKTSLLIKIIKNSERMFEIPPMQIYYFYSIWQKKFDEIKSNNVIFINSLPNSTDIEGMDSSSHKLIIIDDMQISAMNDPFIANLFSRDSHHRNITVFLILQNLYHQGKYSRDIALNAHYLIIFRNPRDQIQLKTLGRQIGSSMKLMKSYEDATSEKFGYLLIDMSPASNPMYMFRSHILPSEYTIIYK